MDALPKSHLLQFVERAMVLCFAVSVRIGDSVEILSS